MLTHIAVCLGGVFFFYFACHSISHGGRQILGFFLSLLYLFHKSSGDGDSESGVVWALGVCGLWIVDCGKRGVNAPDQDGPF